MRRPITTEITKGDRSHPKIWLAETSHQQYLAKPGNRQYCSAEPTGKKLAPLEQWGLSPELAAKHAPKLPPAFWKSYDGSVRAPHAPAAWAGGKSAERAAEESAAVVAAAAAAEQAAAEAQASILIHHCGGCGFQAHADELSSYLAGLGLSPTLLQDRAATGRFTVRVRGGGGGALAVVHAKTAESDAGAVEARADGGGEGQDGFVDNVAKLQAILTAVAGAGLISAAQLEQALEGSPPMPSGVLGALTAD